MFQVLSKPDVIQDMIKSDYDGYRREMKYYLDCLNNIVKCESPIESLLFWALQYTEHEVHNKEIEGLVIIGVHSQWGIELEDYKIKFDIFIRAWHERKERVECYVIECDGHEFHQKTKEQAARDKWRDRLVSRHGFHLLRFTGSEIYRRPKDIAIEIFDRILSDFRKTSNG